MTHKRREIDLPESGSAGGTRSLLPVSRHAGRVRGRTACDQPSGIPCSFICSSSLETRMAGGRTCVPSSRMTA